MTTPNIPLHRLLEMGEIGIALGYYDGAIERLRAALTLNPDHAYAHGLLAGALYFVDRHEAAEREARLAVMLDPSVGIAQVYLALILVEQGRRREAELEVERALTIMPQSQRAHLAWAKLILLKDPNADVEPIIREALALEIDEGLDLLAWLAEVLMARGDVDGAERCAHEALSQDKKSARAFYIMGTVHLHRGRVAEAREHALKALAIDSSALGTIKLLAKIRRRRSEIDGLWWHTGAAVIAGGPMRAVAATLGAFFISRALAQILTDLGRPILGYSAYLLCLDVVALMLGNLDSIWSQIENETKDIKPSS